MSTLLMRNNYGRNSLNACLKLKYNARLGVALDLKKTYQKDFGILATPHVLLHLPETLFTPGAILGGTNR